MLSVEQALSTVLAQAIAVGQIEAVSTLDAFGRVLARAVTAPIAVPPIK